MSETKVIGLPQANSSSIASMDPLLAMIERAARDPSIDMDRLERLLEMKERQDKLVAQGAYNDAMSLVQQEISPIARDSHNPQTRSKYASYFAVDKAIRPIYTRHGIRVSFNEEETEAKDIIRVFAIVTKGLHQETFHYDSPIVTTGLAGKAMMTQTHAKASGVTYAKRYLMGMIFNLSTGEDKDGNDDGALISQADVVELRKALQAYAPTSWAAEEEALCGYFKLETIDQMPLSSLQRAKDAIAKKAKLGIAK